MLVDRFGVSERRACRVVGQHRSTQRLTPRPRPEAEEKVRRRLREIARGQRLRSSWGVSGHDHSEAPHRDRRQRSCLTGLRPTGVLLRMSESSTENELDRMRSLYGAERSEECLALAGKLWDRYGEDADACLGECWRFAMIAATKLDRPDEAVVWRSRARSAFARTECRNGTAVGDAP